MLSPNAGEIAFGEMDEKLDKILLLAQLKEHYSSNVNHMWAPLGGGMLISDQAA